MCPKLEQLKWSLQALALPAELQLQQFPDFVVVTDELMADFDNWWRAAASAHPFSLEQQSALRRLDEMFERMSKSAVPDLSIAAELREHPSWQEVRELARHALEAFGWGCEVPPKQRAAYVRAPEG